MRICFSILNTVCYVNYYWVKLLVKKSRNLFSVNYSVSHCKKVVFAAKVVKGNYVYWYLISFIIWVK